MKIMRGIFIGIVTLVVMLVVALRLIYGGGEPFPDRTSAPALTIDRLQTVTNLDTPPGNIAVAADGRIFFSLHPEAKPSMNVVELVNGRPQPYPSAEFQLNGSNPLRFHNVLSVRIDRQNRLWVLDNADHGSGQPRILAFDLQSNALVKHYDFPNAIFGLGSHANDFQVDPAGQRIYIADASIFAKSPAIVIYDIEHETSRRVLENHISVKPDFFTPVVQGRKMEIFGLFAIRPGIDSIALDKRGEWLYYGAVSAQNLYRVRVADLDDAHLSASELADRVQTFAPKTMSDGITMDVKDNIYLSDPEHSAILRMTPNGKMQTLFKDPKLRWPDGFSFGPGGWLYVTCSSLQQVIGLPASSVREHAPYQIFRFKPGVDGVAGH